MSLKMKSITLPPIDHLLGVRHLGGALLARGARHMRLLKRQQVGALQSYSYLSALSGSTFVALLAGTKHAINATSPNPTAITANVHGSRGLTPNSMLVKLSRYLVNP